MNLTLIRGMRARWNPSSPVNDSMLKKVSKIENNGRDKINISIETVNKVTLSCVDVLYF